MALNYDFSKVKDHKKLTDEQFAVLDILIWATMAVGFTAITKTNYEEFYKRLHFKERLTGSYLNRRENDKTVERYITEDEVKRFIGLSTNAGNFSRSEFVRRQQKQYFDN